MTESKLWVDGNALAGPLHDLFSVDVTAAVGRCVTCGSSATIAQSRLFDHGPGMVARCANCDQVLLRMVRAPGRTWLDLRGLAYLQITMPDDV